MTVFDHTHRRFVSYIDKSREFYLNKGFGNPYRWASNADAPFAALTKPLSESRVGLVTTAARDEEMGRNRRVFSGISAETNALHTHHLSWHKVATHTDDLSTYLPIRQLAAQVKVGRIASQSPRFYGIPTRFSQRQSSTEHAPMILDMCREDAVDVALLVAL